MKTQLKAQLLQHLVNKKKGNEGFTLIELLVVIIIIGILSAIALPAFLNQANRARQTEAVTYVGSVNRAQQAYRLESPRFSDGADGIKRLGLGIQTETEFYVYGDGAGVGSDGEGETGTAGTTYIPQGGAATNAIAINAAPDDGVLLGYAGATYTLLLEEGGDATTTAILCTSTTPGTIANAVGNDSLGDAGAQVTVAATKECAPAAQ